MKRVLQYLSFTLFAGLISCSDHVGDPSTIEDMVDEAVEKAEEAVPLKSDGLLGIVPDLAKRNQATLDSLQAMLTVSARTLIRKFDEAQKIEQKSKISEKLRAFYSKGDSVYQALRLKNEANLEKESKKLVGKALTISVDENFFKTVDAHIKEITPDGKVIIAYKAKTADFIRKKFQATYFNRSNKPIQEPYTVFVPFPIWKGATFEGTTTVPIQVLDKAHRILFAGQSAE